MILVEGTDKNLGKRFYANVIDYAVVSSLLGFYLFLAGKPNDEGGYTLTGMKVFVIPLIWFLYFPLWEAVGKQTVGKRIFELYVIDYKGESPTLMQAILRRILDPIELLFLGIPGLIAINHSPRSQRLGDMLAETLVVRTNAICSFCATEVELNTREVISKVFMCPRCNKINDIPK